MIEDLLISFVIHFLERTTVKENKFTDQGGADDNPRHIKQLDNLSPGDWKKLFYLASTQGVDMILFHCLEGNMEIVPEEQKKIIKNQYTINLLRNMTLSGELNRLLQAFKKEGVTTLVLKGASLAENFYLLQELRPYSDIDILIHQHDMQKVKETLKNMDYSPPEKSEEEFMGEYWYSQHFVRKDNNIFLEIHWNIAQLERYKINIESIWNNAILYKTNGMESLMMSTEDLVLYQSLHLSYHYYNRLLWLLDLALIIQKERNSISWEKIIERCRAQRICNPVYYTFIYIKNLLKIDIPENVLKELKPGLLTDTAIKLMLNTHTLPERKIYENRRLRFPFALLLLDRLPEKVAFGMEFLRRIPSMNRLYLNE